MRSSRPELHVAQQLRRDKLRIQNSSHHLQDYPNNLEHLPPPPHPGGFNNLDLVHVRNVRNGNMLDDPSLYTSSEIINFPTPRNTFECPELSSAEPSNRLMMAPQYGSFPNSSFNNIHASNSKEQHESRNMGNWRNSDWMVNYASSSVANELNDVSYVKPSCSNVLMDLQSSSSLYHNALQDILKSNGSEMASLIHQSGHSMEHVIHPSTNLWTNNRIVDNNTLSWNSSPLSFTDKKVNTMNDSVSNPQGLSLSLSSNSQGSSVSKDCGKMKSPQEPIAMSSTSSMTYRNVGPLGPFTGYATILKSSRFLKPCQQLLDECCCEVGAKFLKGCDGPEWVSRCVSTSVDDAVNVDDSGVGAKGTSSSSGLGASSSMFCSSSNENSGNNGGAVSNFCLSSRPECQKNKAKLLCMQEEVTRRYKQYHQHMQMVVSSFESVAGLSSATPYVSLALKSVSRHFRCLKNAISDQLKLICEVLGEDLSIPTSNYSGNMSRLRCMDQRNKSGEGSVVFPESQQHVWRPQRGLPERAVAILKAWLFEHFLHPYPTDTDKHMLATQTGLSRNQVSNWFINARVRVWKPMVEEIHMLETKGATCGNPNSSKTEGTSASEGSSSQHRVDQVSTHAANAITEKQFQCLEMGSSLPGNERNGIIEAQWNQEKRSKLESQITPSMDGGTLMGFMPYRRDGLEVGGLGSVSLTLGLRHGFEGVQQHQQQQQLEQEEQLRHHFGGHMIHDFVG